MQIIERNGRNITVLDFTETVNSAQDVLDLIATAQYQGGSNTLVFYKENLNEAFFDLKTRLAGEVLQKFSNYNARLAIVGDFSVYKSKALHDFIYECNKGKQVFWVSSLDAALDVLSR